MLVGHRFKSSAVILALELFTAIHATATETLVMVLAAVVIGSAFMPVGLSALLGASAWAFYTGFVTNVAGVLTFRRGDLAWLAFLVGLGTLLVARREAWAAMLAVGLRQSHEREVLGQATGSRSTRQPPSLRGGPRLGVASAAELVAEAQRTMPRGHQAQLALARLPPWIAGPAVPMSSGTSPLPMGGVVHDSVGGQVAPKLNETLSDRGHVAVSLLNETRARWCTQVGDCRRDLHAALCARARDM